MPTLPFDAFPFCGPSYQTEGAIIDAQRTINLYPEINTESGAKTPVAFVGRPGLQLFTTMPYGPIRGLWAGNGRLFVCAGTHFYEINPLTGAIIQDYGAMSGVSVGSTLPVQIVSSGNQLLVMDPSGFPNPKIFNANPATYTMDYVHDGWSLEYLDNFYFSLDIATNKISQSAGVYGGTALGGTSWPALDYVIKTGTVDLATRLIVVNNLLWVMGQSNIEVWYNVGSSGFTLARMSNGTINQGIFGGYQYVPAYTAVRVQNTVLWMGANAERGYAQFWKADGLSPARISTPGIEVLLQAYGNLQGATSFAEEYSGHIFYVTNFPNANSGLGATLVYDLTTNQWHERSYTNGSNQERARPNCFASLQHPVGGLSTGNATNYVGDYANGNIYLQSTTYASDHGTAITYTRTTPHVTSSNRWTKHQSFTMDAYLGSTVPTLAWSNDGGYTFNSPKNMQLVGTIAASGLNTYRQWQLGRSRDRVYKFSCSSTADLIRISNAWLSVEPGTEP
mgnify:FL=1